MSNDPQCNFGYETKEDIAVLKEMIGNHCKEESKKINQFLTWMNITRDDRFPKIERRVQEVENMSTTAIKESSEAKKSVKWIVLTVLAGMLGLMATNIINQIWTSDKMDRLYIILEQSVKNNIKG